MESYLLSWYFAANYIEMDSFEKRGERGILFTIGDEPCLTNLPKSAINEIFSSADQSSYSDVELIEMVQKKFNVFHLHVNHGGYSSDKILEQWKKLLGQNCVEVKKYTDIPKIVSDIVISNTKSQAVNHNSEPYIVKIENTAHESTSPEIML